LVFLDAVVEHGVCGLEPECVDLAVAAAEEVLFPVGHQLDAGAKLRHEKRKNVTLKNTENSKLICLTIQILERKKERKTGGETNRKFLVNQTSRHANRP
jgi:hypothetical protein